MAEDNSVTSSHKIDAHSSRMSKDLVTTGSSEPGSVLENNDRRIPPSDCFHGNGNESAAENS